MKPEVELVIDCATQVPLDKTLLTIDSPQPLQLACFPSMAFFQTKQQSFLYAIFWKLPFYSYLLSPPPIFPGSLLTCLSPYPYCLVAGSMKVLSNLPISKSLVSQADCSYLPFPVLIL